MIASIFPLIIAHPMPARRAEMRKIGSPLPRIYIIVAPIWRAPPMANIFLLPNLSDHDPLQTSNIPIIAPSRTERLIAVSTEKCCLVVRNTIHIGIEKYIAERKPENEKRYLSLWRVIGEWYIVDIVPFFVLF